jgi:hypothetical protein
MACVWGSTPGASVSYQSGGVTVLTAQENDCSYLGKLNRLLKKGVRSPLPHGRGSVNACKHAVTILSRAREQAVSAVFQQPAKDWTVGAVLRSKPARHFTRCLRLAYLRAADGPFLHKRDTAFATVDGLIDTLAVYRRGIDS